MNGYWVLCFAAVLVVVHLRWSRWRSISLLRRWALENGVQLLNAQRRGVRNGPFLWSSYSGQTVYRVTIRDREGRTKTAWARCGGSSFGLIRPEVLVVLDGDEPRR